MKVDRVIILAAGLGSRMFPITEKIPKPLVKINGTRIIDTIINACLSAHIPEIIVVAGYHIEAFDQLKKDYPMIKIIENKDFSTANNISSVVAVGDLVCNAYVIEGDLFIKNPALISEYQSCSNYVTIPVETTNDWCFKIDEDGFIKSIAVGGENCEQMVGISYWTPEDGKKLCAYAKKLYEHQKNLYWDQIALEYHIDEFKVKTRHCTRLDVFEIDTVDELKQLERKLTVMNIPRKILLNPGPATTTETVKLSQLVPDICPREQDFINVMNSIRSDLLKVINADSKDYSTVLFAGSGTLAMDVCINSLLPADKKILIINNGAYSSRAVKICKAYKLDYIELQFPIDELPDLTQIENVLSSENIGVIYQTHMETGTGILNPIRKINHVAHKYNVVNIVDTISTFAMLPINVYDDEIDFCMSSSQKGIQAMSGLSFIIGKKDLIEQSKNYPVRSFYCNLYSQYYGFEKTGEMQFTPPVQTIYSVSQALKEYFTGGGGHSKFQRLQKISDAIHQELQLLGLQEFIKPELQSGLVITVKYPTDDWNFESVHNYCYDHGFTIYPGKISSSKTFRLCTFGDLTVDDIKNFFEVFKQALNQ